MMVYVTVTKSHNHVLQWNIVEGFKSNNVITACFIHIDFKVNIYFFRID